MPNRTHNRMIHQFNKCSPSSMDPNLDDFRYIKKKKNIMTGFKLSMSIIIKGFNLSIPANCN